MTGRLAGAVVSQISLVLEPGDTTDLVACGRYDGPVHAAGGIAKGELELAHFSHADSGISAVSGSGWVVAGLFRFFLDVQRPEISDTLLGELPSLLDEVVLDSAHLGGREGLYPIDGAFSDGDLRAPARAPACLCCLR